MGISHTENENVYENPGVMAAVFLIGKQLSDRQKTYLRMPAPCPLIIAGQVTPYFSA